MATKVTRDDGTPSSGHGGVREGAGRPPNWLAPMNGLREDMQRLSEQVDALPLVARFLFRNVVENILELARKVARTEYQLAEGFRLMDHRLGRMEDDRDRQKAREKEKDAQALERAVRDQAEMEALRAQLVASREQIAVLQGISEGMEAHLSRIQNSVRIVPAAVPEAVLARAATQAMQLVLRQQVGAGAIRLPPPLSQRARETGMPARVANPHPAEASV